MEEENSGGVDWVGCRGVVLEDVLAVGARGMSGPVAPEESFVYAEGPAYYMAVEIAEVDATEVDVGGKGLVVHYSVSEGLAEVGADFGVMDDCRDGCEIVCDVFFSFRLPCHPYVSRLKYIPPQLFRDHRAAPS